MKRTFFLFALALCIIWSGWKCWAQDGDIFVVISGRRVSNVVVVAKSGGQYKSIQRAVDSITDASEDNPYLVVVGPGIYDLSWGSVTLKPHVHLQGAGKNVTIIQSEVFSGDSSLATVVLDAWTSVRDLTILNDGTLPWEPWHHIAVLAPDWTIGAVVADVEAHASGGHYAHGVLLRGSGTRVTLQNVTAVAEQASNHNRGLNIRYSTTKLIGGTFVGRGGSYANGIRNYSGTLTAIGITAKATSGTNNVGVDNLESGCTSFITQSVLESDEFSVRGTLSPTVTVTHTRLMGSVSGTCTCVGVSEGTTFYTDTCP